MDDAQVEEVCVYVCVEARAITRAFEKSLTLAFSTLSALISASPVRGKVNTALKDSSLIL